MMAPSSHNVLVKKYIPLKVVPATLSVTVKEPPPSGLAIAPQGMALDAAPKYARKLYDRWKREICCSCCYSWRVCCAVSCCWFLPCVYGQVWTIADDGGSRNTCIIIAATLFFLAGVPYAVGQAAPSAASVVYSIAAFTTAVITIAILVTARQRIRTRHHIRGGNPCFDLCCAVWCASCVICQLFAQEGVDHDNSYTPCKTFDDYAPPDEWYREEYEYEYKYKKAPSTQSMNV